MVKIKICGITNVEDYNAAVSLGIDYVGFIFYSKSPRYASPEKVREIMEKGTPTTIKKVGVFVNEMIKTVRDVFESANLDLVQLHGDESPSYCCDINLPFWKAMRIKDNSSIDALDEFSCPVFLFDTFSRNHYGGTGKRFDLEIAKEAIKRGKNIMVAGGVSSKNVKEIIKISPYGIDLNSSIESSPGKKDLSKMKFTIEKIKQEVEFHD